MFIEIDGARIFFDVVGSSLEPVGANMCERPTLIALHGGPGFDHSPMRPYFDRYADTHQVIYLDMRGNGRSSGPQNTWTLVQWGKDLKTFCDKLGIEKPVVFGVSFGGMVAMSYATQFPDHPSKLILGSTAAKLDLQTTYEIMEKRGGLRAREVAERVFTIADDETMVEYMAVCAPLYNLKSDPTALESRSRAIIRHDVARHFFLGEMRTMDQLANLRRITCPTLVMVGRQDPITPLRCSEAIMANLMADVGELVIFENAGHPVHRDDPEGADRAVRKFLGRSGRFS